MHRNQNFRTRKRPKSLGFSIFFRSGRKANASHGCIRPAKESMGWSAPNHQIFFRQIESTCYSKHLGTKIFWICLNPQFSMPSQSPTCSVARSSFRESGVTVADDIYPGTKHNGASVCSLYLLEKIESKINHSNIFWDWIVRVCLRIISFSSLELELRFDSKDSEINFDRAHSTTGGPDVEYVTILCWWLRYDFSLL